MYAFFSRKLSFENCESFCLTFYFLADMCVRRRAFIISPTNDIRPSRKGRRVPQSEKVRCHFPILEKCPLCKSFTIIQNLSMCYCHLRLLLRRSRELK